MYGLRLRVWVQGSGNAGTEDPQYIEVFHHVLTPFILHSSASVEFFLGGRGFLDTGSAVDLPESFLS